MDRHVTDDEFASTRHELPEARHLPGHVYTSTETLALEKQRIFLKTWLCVGRSEEIANPGDYMAIRIMDEPVVLVRDESGKVNAFANVCRHRGVELVQGSGNLPMFTCPYHAWTYKLTGELRSSPYMRESATDLKECRLPSIRLEDYRGWMFLNFDKNAQPFSDFIATFDAEFGFLQPNNCRLVAKTVYHLNCNWKFVYENLMDVYHVGTLHMNTFGHRYKGDRDRYTFGLRPHGTYSFFFDAAPLTDDGESRFGKMPWLGDRRDSFACMGSLAPNVNISSRCDVMRHWVTWPTAVDRSTLISYSLVPEDVAKDPDIDGKMAEYIKHLNEVIDEDREMVESLQNGVQSGLFDPGPLSKLEGPIHHVLTHYLDSMGW